MYYFVLYLMGVLLVFASCIHIYANVLGKEKPKFYATESSSDSLYEELVAALNKTEKRCKYYKIAYYTLNFVNVIGGVSISTVYINSMFSYCMGFAGFFVLISSLFILFLRPEENLYRTKNEITFLKKTRNKYDSMSDKNKAKTYLLKNLNEFCYKFNRKYFGDRLYDRLILCSVCYRPTFEHQMYGLKPKGSYTEGCG